MDWKTNTLIHLKQVNGKISRRNLESLLMGGADYPTSTNRFIELIDEGLITRNQLDSHSFQITDQGSSLIEETYINVVKLMELVSKQLSHHFGELNVRGGATGLFFSYGKMHMFRFHPFIQNSEILLLARLPNLIAESSDWVPNQIYIRREVLEKTTFLHSIIAVHLKMIDDVEAYLA